MFFESSPNWEIISLLELTLKMNVGFFVKLLWYCGGLVDWYYAICFNRLLHVYMCERRLIHPQARAQIPFNTTSCSTHLIPKSVLQNYSLYSQPELLTHIIVCSLLYTLAIRQAPTNLIYVLLLVCFLYGREGCDVSWMDKERHI